MKKLIIILSAIVLLGCEKEEQYQEYILNVFVKNEHTKGNSGVVPTGYSYTYLENGEYKTATGEYVGNAFEMYWNNKQPLFISARTPNDCDVTITVSIEGKLWKEARGYKHCKIDE